jgi:hypothetical protein
MERKQQMKRTIVLLFIIFLSIILSGAGTKEDPAPCWQTESVSIQFADVYTEKNAVLVSIDAYFYDGEGTLVKKQIITDNDGISPVDGAFKVPIFDTVNGLDNGVYSVQVRVFDKGGSASPWSEKLWFRKEWRPLPQPPVVGPLTERGDVNGDGKVNVADISALINYLY